MLMQRHRLTTIPHRVDTAGERTRERLEDDQSDDRDDVWIDEKTLIDPAAYHKTGPTPEDAFAEPTAARLEPTASFQ